MSAWNLTLQNNLCKIFFVLRACSVDFLDGGATDMWILGPMELKMAFLFYFFIPTDLQIQNHVLGTTQAPSHSESIQTLSQLST